jgi:hypothetical protein
MGEAYCNNSGSFSMFAAIRRASPLVSNFAACLTFPIGRARSYRPWYDAVEMKNPRTFSEGFAHDKSGVQFLGPRRREAATLADHRYQTSLTVVSRQKRRFVTPVTLQNAGSTLCIDSGSVEYAEIYDVGQKDHCGFGAACNRNDGRNDWCFCQRT